MSAVPTDAFDRIATARGVLAAPARIAVLTGAGMSTEAGIPDFRSPGGLYDRDFHGLPPEYLLSHDCLIERPELFTEYLRERLNFGTVAPDDSYRLLARLETAGRIVAVATQNIDGLHSAAGSQRVVEAHGSMARFTCLRCEREVNAAMHLEPDAPVFCECGGTIRPDVVLFGEALPNIDAAFALVDEADVLLVLGTSLVVYPVAAIPEQFVRAGKPVVIVNRDHTQYADAPGVIELNTQIGTTLPELFPNA